MAVLLGHLPHRCSRPTDKPYKLADGGGLCLLVPPSGAKLWRWRYRFDGKEKMMALGEYPLVSMKEARERHSEARKALTNGIDPMAERKAEGEAKQTLGNLSAFYAMFPGNHKFNVFPLWLAEDHHARLSSVFAPHIGHPHSEDLDSEYLNIFETRTTSSGLCRRK